ARADHQRRPARPGGSRQELAVTQLVELAVEVDPAVSQEGPDDREGLLEPGYAAIERETERPIFRLVPSGAETEDQPSTADLVDRVRHLREHRRVVEARAGHERSELDPGRGRGDRRQHRPDLPRAASPELRRPVEEVVADPDGVEADVLGCPGDGQVFGPTDLTLD